MQKEVCKTVENGYVNVIRPIMLISKNGWTKTSRMILTKTG